MRGKAAESSYTTTGCRITTACAGKRDRRSNSNPSNRDHPRMCGEKKSFANSIEMELGSPPHVRGKEKGGVKMALISRITPACAGKSFLMDYCCLFPLGSPPHVRGKGYANSLNMLSNRITPACAGKRNPDCKTMVRVQDHPRMCGEKDFCSSCSALVKGSPPHVRGKADRKQRRTGGRGITPACAGKSLQLGSTSVFR